MGKIPSCNMFSSQKISCLLIKLNILVRSVGATQKYCMVVNQEHSRVRLRCVKNVTLNVGLKQQVDHFGPVIIFFDQMMDFWLGENFIRYLSKFWRGLDFFVNEEVGVFLFFLVISKGIFLNSSKTLIFHFFQVKLGNSFIIKVVPRFLICSYIRCVVSCFWNTVMDHHALQFVLVFFLFSVWLIQKPLLCVWKEVYIFWEWTVCVQFKFLHGVKVELKTF